MIKTISKKHINFVENINIGFHSKHLVLSSRSRKLLSNQISHLGKELVLVKSLLRDSKKAKRDNRHILSLLVHLFDLNMHVHDSLLHELKSNKLHLKRRINISIKSKKVHHGIHNKLLKTANDNKKHVINHARNHSKRKKYSLEEVANTLEKHTSALSIYEVLGRKDFDDIIKGLIYKKLVVLFEGIVELTVELSELIVHALKSIASENPVILVHYLNQMKVLIEGKQKILDAFAVRYGYEIIHNTKFRTSNGKKLVLIK